MPGHPRSDDSEESRVKVSNWRLSTADVPGHAGQPVNHGSSAGPRVALGRWSTFSAVDELTRLAHAARLGDTGALEAFVEASYGQVRRFCAALAGTEAADDLAQETYVRCMRGLRRFRGDASARTWILAIARHVCLDELRSRGRRGVATPLADDLAAGAVPDVAEETAVADLLARLDPGRRAAFVLTQVFRMPYQEAAVVCECPIGTIRSRVARAREDLIAMLSESQSAPLGRRGEDRRPSSA
jgi:RNA polymerase sigma-70 factor, ECF subfamily